MHFFYSIVSSAVTALATSGSIFFLVYYFFYIKKGEKTSEDQREVESLINDRLDAIIDRFKTEIPIITTFLTKKKEEALKVCAKEELLKLVPELKKQMLPLILTQKLKRLPLKIILTTLVVGLLLGLLNALISLIDFFRNSL